MRIIISGASGDLGRRVTDLLLRADAEVELTLVTRSPEKLAARAAAGIRVVPGDYQDAESLRAAYQGGGTLFMISGLNLGRRMEEHRNAISAAKEAGIGHIVYTSVGGVQPSNPALSARDHYQTELDLRASDIAYTFLRNALYSEIVGNVLVAPALESGVFSMAAGTGRLAPVAKADVARSAMTVLLEPERHAGAVYEITGPELLDFHDVARIASDVYQKAIAYQPVSAEERLAFFDSIGVPRTYDPSNAPSAEGHLWASDELVTADVAQAQGYQALLSGHVEQLTGEPATALRSVMEAAKSRRYSDLYESA
jgi:NAD(P)H dehydrogenase (quinone)